MIINTANAALLEELATHSSAARSVTRGTGPDDQGKKRKSVKSPRNPLLSLAEKIQKMATLSEEEIQMALETGLIYEEQVWNWAPSNIDSLREGLKDVEQKNCIGPFSDVDDLVSALNISR